jgi:hypothetical protein
VYGKIFKQIYKGTLAMVGPWEALVTFQQMIILADQDGIVDMTADALSRETTIPLDIIEKGIKALESPDPESRTPDHEGRRIIRLSDSRSWGWRLVNYEHYRKLRSEEERREYHRQYYREKRSKSVTKKKLNSTQQHSTDSTNSRGRGSKQKVEVIQGLNQSAWNDYLSHRKELRAKTLTPRGEQMAMKKLAALPHDKQQMVVDNSIQNGWIGLFPEKVNEKTKSSDSFDAKLQRLREKAGIEQTG